MINLSIINIMKVFEKDFLNALQKLQTLPNLKCSQIVNALNALIKKEEDRFILQISKDLYINLTSIKLSENPGFFTITILKPNGKEVREEIKIGKLIQQLIDIKPKADELEDFTNNIKFFQFGDDPTFRLVEGEDIVYYYHPHHSVGTGELGNSCMAKIRTQEFLQFYARNNKVKLFLKIQEKKTAARALLWETDKGLYLDRIYAIYNEYKLRLLKEAQKRFELYDFYKGKNVRVNLKVEVPFLDKNNAMQYFYPYLDTFKYLVVYNNKSILYSSKKVAFSEKDNAVDIVILNRTNGEYEDRYGYDRQGFDRNGFNRQGFDREGYDRQGFDRDGYDRDGYDRNGFDRYGYDRDGYDRDGYDYEGFNRWGYDREGFDWDGYDRDGYNRDGFNGWGFDRQGFDREGFDREGYDREGYNCDGYDRNGYNRNGYDRDGFDRFGFDRDGFDREGFNMFGYDRDGFTRNERMAEILLQNRIFVCKKKFSINEIS